MIAPGTVNTIMFSVCVKVLQWLCISGVIFVSVQCAHRTIEEAKEERASLVKKYFKKLKKHEGAIKLVGGRTDNEGDLKSFFL